MTRLLDSTLAQLTTAFATAARLDTRTHFEVSTIQMVYAALVELEERRRGDALPFTADPSTPTDEASLVEQETTP